MATSAPSLPDAVVFDLDGTLVDSVEDIATALGHTFAAAGLLPFDAATVKTMVGGGSRRLIERALAARGEAAASDRIDALTADFERHYVAAPCERTRVFPGAVALLAELASHRVNLGLCTNKAGAVTHRMLALLELDRFFPVVVTGSDGLAKKPDPAMLTATLARLGAQPGRSVMLGDSAADVGTARGAGCPVLLVSFGYSAKPARELGADAVIDDFAEAVPALGRLVRAAGSK